MEKILMREMEERPDIRSLYYPELEEQILAMGEKRFRAQQLWQWMHQKLAPSFEDMTSLPASFRARLKEAYGERMPQVSRRLVSSLDGTEKYLFRLWDGNQIESVLMRYRHGNSVCISTQAGCAMGCRFCASTIGGKSRNLLPSEMLGQIYQIQNITGERVSHVVAMGTGEPLDNYDHFLRFLRILTGGDGLKISQRNVTVSTCGIVPGIRKLAGEKLQITLAISLHASTQEKRMELMPIAKRYPLEELMEACAFYFDQTGRRITFEYSLIANVNDSPADAASLARLVRGLNCHINLIPVNPVEETGFQAPSRPAAEAFKNRLEKYGINVTIRREMGRDINGACGQLRRSAMETPEGGG